MVRAAAPEAWSAEAKAVRGYILSRILRPAPERYSVRHHGGADASPSAKTSARMRRTIIAGPKCAILSCILKQFHAWLRELPWPVSYHKGSLQSPKGIHDLLKSLLSLLSQS